MSRDVMHLQSRREGAPTRYGVAASHVGARLSRDCSGMAGSHVGARLSRDCGMPHWRSRHEGAPTRYGGVFGEFAPAPRLRVIMCCLLMPLLAALAPVCMAQDVVAAARTQVGVTTTYDGRYERLDYPGGDVPIERGVCTDVLVRAFRATGLDLQVVVHEDMRRAFAAYPRLWGLSAPDRNIDHRRVPNLETWFARHGERGADSDDGIDYLPGDVVSWRLPNGLPHIGLVSDRRSAAGVPLVIHNIGAGAQEEDVLFAWPVHGHWRLPPRTAAASR
jgi:uncharacterized protein YijF (DUF1287 family)